VVVILGSRAAGFKMKFCSHSIVCLFTLVVAMAWVGRSVVYLSVPIRDIKSKWLELSTPKVGRDIVSYSDRLFQR